MRAPFSLRAAAWSTIAVLSFAACHRDPSTGRTATTTSPATTSTSSWTTSTTSSTTSSSWSTTTSADTTSTSTGAGGGDAGPPASLNVLFVGNSYTYVNDLPGWVHDLATSGGFVSVTVDSVTVGGATLMDHVQTTGAMVRIQQGGWTHVVLQGQSAEPLSNPQAFEAAAATLAAASKSVGAIPVFYETWARAAGDALYQQPWSGGSPAAMQAGLRAEYLEVAVAAGGVVAPAGDAWEKALAQWPSIGLFQADGSHPSIHGTYLVASVFYARLTGHSPVGIAAHPASMSAADAAALQDVAEQVAGK